MPGSWVTILLWRAGLLDAPPDTQQVEVHESQLRLEGLLPGTYRVRVRPGVDPDYPTGLFFEYELNLELPPGRVVTRSIMLEQCAGLRLTVRDEDGALVGGAFDFLNDQGGRAHLSMVVGEGSAGGGATWSFTRTEPTSRSIRSSRDATGSTSSRRAMRNTA